MEWPEKERLGRMDTIDKIMVHNGGGHGLDSTWGAPEPTASGLWKRGQGRTHACTTDRMMKHGGGGHGQEPAGASEVPLGEGSGGEQTHHGPWAEE